MKLRSMLLTAAITSALSLTAHAAENGTIMILVNSLDNPYYASEAKGADKKAQELGYNTTVLSHGEDVKKQSELIDAAIGKKVQGIVLDNADSTASVAAIKKAKAAGIPVVLINREIPVDDVALVQITHNNFQAGSDVANMFVGKMGEKGKYAELTCSLADNNCVTRSKSFHQVLDQYPEMTSVARQDAKGTLLDGKRIMDSILQAHPDVKGVICGNGPVALGAIAALKAAGRNDVVVVGIDGSNDERDAVKEGALKATVMLQAQAIAAQGVTDLDNYLRKGEKPAKQRVMFRGILITPENANKVQDFNFKS
ncbi:D-ribose ABC transporter substrate-binding protein [Dickeya solani]|uniref:D-ribose ABC transporter substrate-binding protein n=1 Tax=Dickeya solani TaxID=1089444 RepID=A0ABU4EF34_9GAMM|nr:D-ribose ABC transporter substrate-binding protein [Dickeya solani]MCA7001465.1 D-ribose ABC transporter substrate-binding protein [Dickeya solani]MCZ0820892.1 D-ribose ABC transporter substrate-binding protein [Dickeya solani]MDV6996840.1 D-ribose ABC transporter substrate-binding protein [Dickeya solani]MDV7002688.1 D-ribose ABC transporter substrate-binding protein [Dickeya solani]MDV7038662.1 D-ribose ABC transporter substrate-binding protein [Dickeya solani]